MHRVQVYVTLFGWKDRLTKLTVISIKESQEGWIVLSIVVHRSTQMDMFGSPRRNIEMTTT